MFYLSFLFTLHPVLLLFSVGVLRDLTIPVQPIACDLSASQQTVLHYVLNILSTMETMSDDYTDHEIDENDFDDNNLVSFLLYMFTLLYSSKQVPQYFQYCI